MKFSFESMVQRSHNYVIVDEIDSCLIDEARTPLIISGGVEDKTNQYLAVDKLIKNLKKEAVSYYTSYASDESRRGLSIW